MTRNEIITDLLHRVYYDEELLLKSNRGFYQSELDEMESMELIRYTDSGYLLTEMGILLVKSGKNYEDFLRERLAPQTPNTVQTPPHNTNAHPGTVLWKRSLKIFINILNYDYIKYTIITVGSGTIIYFLYEWFKYKKW